MTCSTELCTGATSRCTSILNQRNGTPDSCCWDSRMRDAAVVRSGALETNVFVPFKVVPTRSARVIADKVGHSK